MNFWEFYSLQLSTNERHENERDENLRRSGKIVYGYPSPSQKKAIERRKEQRLREGIKHG